MNLSTKFGDSFLKSETTESRFAKFARLIDQSQKICCRPMIKQINGSISDV